MWITPPHTHTHTGILYEWTKATLRGPTSSKKKESLYLMGITGQWRKRQPYRLQFCCRVLWMSAFPLFKWAHHTSQGHLCFRVQSNDILLEGAIHFCISPGGIKHPALPSIIPQWKFHFCLSLCRVSYRNADFSFKIHANFCLHSQCPSHWRWLYWRSDKCKTLLLRVLIGQKPTHSNTSLIHFTCQSRGELKSALAFIVVPSSSVKP